MDQAQYAEFNRGMKYATKNPVKGISILKSWIAKNGECKEALINLAVGYKTLKKYDEAADYLVKANNPDVPFSDGSFVKAYDVALTNLGFLATLKGEIETAEELYKQALTANPLYFQALWNLAILKLKQLSSGHKVDPMYCWKLYAYRFKRDGAAPLVNSKKDLEVWNMIDRVDSLVVLSEQGQGDILMFARYLELLKEKVGKIWVQCHPKLHGLFITMGYDVCVDPIDTNATHGIPFGHLPKLVDYIPPAEWLSSLYKPASAGERMRIACVWSGNKHHINDANRSTTPWFFRRLMKYADLYTIGPNKKEEGFKHLEGDTWEDTIKNLEKVDLVISVDTSIVHLCGSLGKPCWVLMPLDEVDFRWGFDDLGYDNLWYKSVTVIRNPGSWIETFDNVEKLLKEVLNEKS